jgi:hypothetical protein
VNAVSFTTSSFSFPAALPDSRIPLAAVMQSGVAAVAQRDAFGCDALVGSMCDPVRQRFVGVTNKAPAAPDESRAEAGLAVALQGAGRQFQNSRGFFFEMY